jgi:hypothetical protein
MGPPSPPGRSPAAILDIGPVFFQAGIFLPACPERGFSSVLTAKGPRGGARKAKQEKVMNTRVTVNSVREKLERLVEGLICVVTPAVVLGGTYAICFPTVA